MASSSGAFVLQGVGKHYVLPPPPAYTRRQRLRRLWDLVRGTLLGKSPHADGAAAQTVLADATLVLRPGDVVGICGLAGAGKTTLLRLLAGLDRPSYGRAHLPGSVAGVFALTEGACHRRLSVRDNILLAATRLNLDKCWVRANLGPIVQFAGLETALDTPLGEVEPDAYLRLAWSLAVRPKPDLLLVDEVFLGFDDALRDALGGELAARKADGRMVVMAAPAPGTLAPWCTRIWQLAEGRLGPVPPPDPAPEASAAAAERSSGPPSPGLERAPVAERAPGLERTPLDSRREWYWVSAPQEGWAAYLCVRPDQIRKRLNAGQTLVRATPPWVDAQGVCAMEPYRPIPRIQPADCEFQELADREAALG